MICVSKVTPSTITITIYDYDPLADIECILNTNGCAHSCYNTLGSYIICSCRTGYRLSTDRHL